MQFLQFSLPVSTLPNGRVETSAVIKQHSTEWEGQGLSFFAAWSTEGEQKLQYALGGGGIS